MILVCAATLRELDACLEPAGRRFESLAAYPGSALARFHGNHLFAVTGVGIPMTLARLLPLAALAAPERILNLGIAGAYPGSGLGIGDLVAGESESFGDLGMESTGPEIFLPLSAFPWADEEYRRPLRLDAGMFGTVGSPSLPATRVPQIPRSARGCTVNLCTGAPETGLRRYAAGADFETMEGAAVALAGSELGIPVGEIRAISNIASTRDMRPENITLALGNLGVYMSRWLADHA